MKVSILQLNSVWANPVENIKRAERLMSGSIDSDLFVLPEMWSTGFVTEPKGIAKEELKCNALSWMKEMAINYQIAICGSLAISENGIYRNRLYFVDGKNGIVSYYDKHHLFSYGHEDLNYEPGGEHTIVEYMGFHILLLTCYDLRFPIWSRYAEDLKYDMIIYVANWPESRQNAWQILTRARAIENQAFVVACNRIGDDKYCHYRGQSAIISPIGKTLASCPSNEESSVSFILNLESLVQQRAKFKVLADRDKR